MLRHWVLTKLEAAKDNDRILLRDSLRLLPEADGGIHGFARENGFQYRTVSDAVRGLRQGNYGEGREVRLKLGLPVKD